MILYKGNLTYTPVGNDCSEHEHSEKNDKVSAIYVATTRYLYVVCIYGAICLHILFLKHHILLFCHEILEFFA